MTQCHIDRNGEYFMPTKTFFNLNAEKQNSIYEALYQEFSQSALSEAKVSSIVLVANIPRGSFYTYFDSLIDAYQWVLKAVLTDIHHDINQRNFLLSAELFISKAQESKHFDFLSKYYIVNEALLEHESSQSYHKKVFPTLTADATPSEIENWLLSKSIHQLIRAFFLNPDEKQNIILTLHTLSNWKKEV